MSIKVKFARTDLKLNAQRLFGDSLKGAVWKDILDSDDMVEYLQDVVHHGCISGVVTRLIYYRDTHAFFDNHYDEIEALRQEYQDEMGLPLEITGDLKNDLTWFAYEQVARQILEEWGMTSE